MPRKKAEEVIENNTEVETTKVQKTENSVDNFEKRYAELEQKFNELTATLSALTNNTATSTTKYASSAKYIRVVSLIDGTLNLSTEPNGNGRLFVFDKMGKSQKILDTDLRDIVRNCNRFAEEGDFYICDKEFVEDVGLGETYNTIIDETKFMKLCNGDRDEEALEMFKNASDKQKENIIDIIVRKGANGEISNKFITFFDDDGELGIKEKIKDTKGVIEAYSQK